MCIYYLISELESYFELRTFKEYRSTLMGVANVSGASSPGLPYHFWYLWNAISSIKKRDWF